MKRVWMGILAAILLASIVLPWMVVAQDRGETHRTFQLQHANAADIAPKLRAVLGNPQETEILVDRRSNRVLIKGPAQAYQIAAQLISQLDKPRRADPQVKPVLQAYRVDAGKLETTAQLLRSKFPQARIAPDARTSQLLVVAKPESHAQIARQLGAPISSNTPPAQTPQRQGNSYQLTTLNWRTFEDQLRQLWGDELSLSIRPDGEVSQVRMPQLTGNKVVMEINRRTNHVTFTGTEPMVNYWWRAVQAMDSRQLPQRQTAIMPLENADPDKIKRVVGVMRKASLSAANGDAVQGVNVPADARRPGNLVSMIFQQNQDGGQGQNANKQPAGNNQQNPNNPNAQQVPFAQEDDTGLIGDVQIEFIPELGMIILRGHRRDVAKVRQIINNIIENSKESQPEVEVYPLQHVNGQALANLINPIYTAVYEPRQGPINITALGTPNSLLLIGRMENVEVVKQLISKLDKPLTPQSTVKVFKLLHKSAVDMASQIQQMFPDPGTGTQQGQPGQQGQQNTANLQPRVTVISDFRSNAIIVQAGPRDMQIIEKLVTDLDVDQGPARFELRIFPLKNSQASVLQSVLQQAISGQTQGQTQTQRPPGQPGQPGGQPGGQAPGGQQGSGASQPSVNIRVISKDQMGNKYIESGILSEVQITADDNTNSLIVKAPTKSMGLIEALINQLDKSPEAESQIKVFEVRYGDATNLTVMLQQLFGLQVTAGQQGVFSQTFGQAFGGNQAQITQQTAGESSLIPLRFTTEPRSNSIIASGSLADLAVVEALLARLDEDDLRQRKTTVYRLNNASAQAVSDSLTLILQNLLQLYQGQVNQQLSTIGQREFLEQQVFVQPEVNSNSLIVSATPQYYEMISEVIADLDRRPPMVMIQVLIAEITLDSREETGAELGLQDSLLFNRGLGETPPIGFDFVPSNLPNATDTAALNTRELLAGQAFSAFGLGRTSASAGFPGLVLAASNESISILIRALESSSRLQILSRPQIMTLHNVPASILVGQRVPRITDFQQTTTGTVSTTTLDEVGLRLGVIPRVTPDGLIVMDIEVSKSSVGDPAAGIPIGVQDGVAINSPIFADTTAITTLTARTGQTIVFSGLITKDRSDSYRGVPFLSHIPVLGRLFRFDQHSDKRTELVIFLTPTIVHSGDQEGSHLMNVAETERMSWCLADVMEMHGIGAAGLSPGRPGVWSPKECPTIYPHNDPTGAMAAGVPTMAPRPLATPSAQGGYIVPPGELKPNKPFIVPDGEQKPNKPYIAPPRQSQRRRPRPTPVRTDGGAVVRPAGANGYPARYAPQPVRPAAAVAPPQNYPAQNYPAQNYPAQEYRPQDDPPNRGSSAYPAPNAGAGFRGYPAQRLAQYPAAGNAPAARYPQPAGPTPHVHQPPIPRIPQPGPGTGGVISTSAELQRRESARQQAEAAAPRRAPTTFPAPVRR